MSSKAFVAQALAHRPLAPLNDKVLTGSVKQSVDAKIPGLVFNSISMQGAPRASSATGNFAAGKIAGEAMGASPLRSRQGRRPRYQEVIGRAPQPRERFHNRPIQATMTSVIVIASYGGATPPRSRSPRARACFGAPTKRRRGRRRRGLRANRVDDVREVARARKANLAGQEDQVHHRFDQLRRNVSRSRQRSHRRPRNPDPFNMANLAVDDGEHLRSRDRIRLRNRRCIIVTKANLKRSERQGLRTPDSEVARE